MRISQKLEYSCRALAQLARRYNTHTLTRLEELAQREEVSANFLVQILNDLRRGGLIESKRGKIGGYLLAKEPSAISLYDIVEIIDPSLLSSSTTTIGESGHSVAQVWKSLAADFEKQLKAITLENLSTSSAATMFYI
jgi:Rrf2 family transcriptional regulator, cysteine metabolism repressor